MIKMRQIKFKAWDKTRKEMFNIITWNDPNHLEFDLTAIGQSSDSVIELNKEDTIIMQFTGLKDKNNKDIYEGDIVKFKPCNDMSLRKEFRDEEVKSEIIWDDNLSRFDVNWWGHATYHTTFPHPEMEVIGNKFKNPELLEEK